MCYLNSVTEGIGSAARRRKEKAAGAFISHVLKVTSNESGATSAEYALVLALVVVTLISTLTALGAALNDKLQSIIEQISNAG